MAWKQIEEELDKNEYQSEVENGYDGVSIHVFFNKKLPFPKKLQKTDSIAFDLVKVSAFGMGYFDEETQSLSGFYSIMITTILSFDSLPRDTLHEIILAKGTDYETTLASSIRKINHLNETGYEEARVEKSKWKYIISELDKISIPVIQFNIQENYENPEGKGFLSKGISRKILVAQRNEFFLNENGAVVESEALPMADSIVKITPKRMLFDKPYLIMIKLTNRENPYFVMRVSNNELLKTN
jgi:hypothetical protein